MNWFKAYSKDWVYGDYFLAAIVFIFPIFGRLAPLLIAGFILGAFFSKKRRDLKLLTFKSPLLWFAVFFSMHLIGLFWTDNQSEGWSDVGMKLALVVFPLGFFFVRVEMKRRELLDILLAGLVFSCIVNYGFAVFRSLYHPEDNQWAYFSDAYFSFNMHRSYYALYAVIGVMVSFKRYFDTRNWPYLMVSGLLSVVTLQTFSKVGILLLIFAAVPMACYFFFRIYGAIKTFAFVAAVSLAVLLVFSQSNRLQVRFNKMITAVNGGTENSTGMESNKSRIIMWNTSLQLISEQPIAGYGTGDVQDVLNERNLLLGHDILARKRLNSHNQYLNTTVQLGLLGLIPLVLIFTSCFADSIVRKDLIFFMITFLIAVSLLFESSLERQDGVIPTSLLFLALFVIKKESITNEI